MGQNRVLTSRPVAVGCLIALTVLLQGSAAAKDTSASIVESPPTAHSSPFYTGNREPLLPSCFLKLPIGSIRPSGWLRRQLELEADGMTGHLQEISKWCHFADSAWATRDGSGKFGWEELPYWLKGYGDLGYVLGDQTIIQTARKWIDATLASQDADGYFGPRANKTSLEGQPDLWPHMVMLNVLQSFEEATGDSRVRPFMTRYLKWLNAQPPPTFGRGYWPKIRFGDTIESSYWLYNRTGESFLLELAAKIHSNMARWDTGVINWHNVNIAQGFREPAVYYLQARDRKYLDAAERNYQTVMGLYGQFPGGGFAGDENCRPGFGDPRQGFETCGIVEFMHSFEMLTKISGNPLWADRCEELAFNSLPAAMTPDLKALHYLTCANQVQLDKENKAPGIENGGTMFSYSPYETYRCCQHNVSHGWPYYAEELWLATPDSGLCASLYAPCTVSAKVADGSQIRILEETDYPFSDTIVLRILCQHPVKFPLYLRIPRWCDTASVKLNGHAVRLKTRPLAYARLDRTWNPGDVVTLRLPMHLTLRTWTKNNNAVSVDYGPLTFSLKIGEHWSRYGGSEAWPELELLPTTPWNYGLLLDAKHPERSFKLVRKPMPHPLQPFTPETVPLDLHARARRIPAWRQDATGLVGKLQPSPVRSSEPIENVTLIPMGAARLRITAFPVVGDGPDAQDWLAPKRLPVSASHCHPGDSIEALVDGLVPKASNDQTVPRFTWWDHRGTTEWVQRDFTTPQTISVVEVFWFDDSGTGNCRVPQSWKLSYRDGEIWRPVEPLSEYGTKKDAFNRVTFKPVRTTSVRLEAQLQSNFSAGILEWKAAER